MEIKIKVKEIKYISLKEAAKISGYHPDYIGYLIREGKIQGKKFYIETSWQIAPEEIIKYYNENKGLGVQRASRVRNFDLSRSKIVSKKYISLREAAKISGYHPDYIGYLIRKGKIKGEKVYLGTVWKATEEEIMKYQKLSNQQESKILGSNEPSSGVLLGKI